MIIHSPIFSGSISQDPNNAYANLSGSFTGSFKGIGQFEGLEADSVAYDNVTNKPTLVSGSSQISYPDLSNIPSGIISSSTQLSEIFLDTLGDNVISGSSQVEFNEVNNNPFSQSASSVTVSKSIIPTSATVDLGSSAVPFRDLYLSSASLYIDGQQVISSNTNELVITTDTNQSLKLVESGADTITLQSENGDIVLVATGNGTIELNAPIQIVAGNQILSSDGNAIVFGEDINVQGNISVLGAVDGVDLGALKSEFDTLEGKSLVSGSSQVSYPNLSNIPSGIVSGSSQITPLLPVGTISGSSQVSFSSIVDKPTLVSGSSQIDVTATTGYSAISSHIGNTSNPHSVTKAQVGLGNVDNESKATMFTSPAFTGTPTAPTPADNDNSTNIATTAFVMREVSDLIGGAGAAFDTLLEISASLAAGDSNLNGLVDGKLAKSENLNDLTNKSTARTNLGVAIGTDVQAYNSTLAAVAGGTYSGDDSITTIGTVTAGSVTAILPSGTISGSSQVNYNSIQNQPTIGNGTITVSAGAGLDGGGTFTTNQTGNTTITLTVADGVLSGSSQVNHDSTTGFVANEHIDHTTVSIIAGDGLTGGGTIAASRTINIVGGNGITVNSDNIQLSGGYTGTWAVTGGITATADVVAYASSDERLKDNIEIISNPIEKVQSLKGVTWEWNDNADELQKSTPNVGVIAQDVEKVLPQLVNTRDNGFKAVDYAKLTGLLIEAIKEQQKQIDDLKSRL